MSVDSKTKQEKKTITFMVELYCKKNHKQKEMCSDCKQLLDYALLRIDKCPFKDTKTFCSSCKVHCYQKEKREEIRSVMKFSGPRMLLHHPILAVSHVKDTIKNKRKDN